MKKILIANRGEIACRVAKTAKKMGIETVAVYSEADKNALHVQCCDEAYLLGPPPSNQSYLLMDKIIEIAIQTNCQGIHPGYGFLSENASFANAVGKAGLEFIGPGSYAIETMGSKLAAKDAVKNYDIPLVPGTDYPISDIEEAKKIASKIGFPILIKASAGGGGKGMRIVHKVEEFEENLDMAISEATSAFGDGSVFIEKYVAGPRHIEFQILADKHGNVIHLFERECSVQRRHQKVVEEAPSAILTPELRKKMGIDAVNTAKACKYEGAGTVEFLLDESNNYYFLEMNTRLQVEHPVTEEITGIDLVEEQIRIARGEPLRYKQDDLEIKGHAIELRVYAEDPEDNFLPSIAQLDKYVLPQGDGIRVDNGYREGDDIPIYYDPMISKLVTFGETRERAIQLMKKAINQYEIKGIKTTLPFGFFVMDHVDFISGNFDTHFVKKNWNDKKYASYLAEDKKILAALAYALEKEVRKKIITPNH
jgi:acetyl-CoA carboxylase biotin carboxylase subunit